MSEAAEIVGGLSHEVENSEDCSWSRNGPRGLCARWFIWDHQTWKGDALYNAFPEQVSFDSFAVYDARFYQHLDYVGNAASQRDPCSPGCA